MGDNNKGKTKCTYCEKYFVNIESHSNKCRKRTEEIQRIFLETQQKEQQELDEEIFNFEKKYPRIMNMIKNMKDEIQDLKSEIERNNEESSF